MAIGIASLLFLSSCAKDDSSKSKDADGNCTADFVNDYNSALSELKNLTYLYSEQQVQTAVNACDRFLSNHKGVACKADVDYKTKQISATDLQKACDEARQCEVKKENL